MKLLTALTVTAGVLTLTACEPIDPPTCEAAIGLAFIDKPVTVRVRMQRISWRESHNNPRAKNRHSSATGCLQLLRIHEGIARRLGYSWADMTKAWPNARVARVLFDGSGFQPWAMR